MSRRLLHTIGNRNSKINGVPLGVKAIVLNEVAAIIAHHIGCLVVAAFVGLVPNREPVIYLPATF